MNQRLWRASRVRRTLLAGSSVLALLALASPAEAIPGDCLDALKTSGDPFLVGFANGITPVGQLFCLGTQPGITVGIATPGVQEIFFGIGNEVVNGNVTVLETTNLGNEGIGVAPAAVQGHLVAFNIGHGLPATFPSAQAPDIPGGLVIIGSTINGAIINNGTLTGLTEPQGIGALSGLVLPATSGMFISGTQILGPSAGIINTGTIIATPGDPTVPILLPGTPIPTKLTGINFQVAGVFAGTIMNSGTIMSGSSVVPAAAVGIEVDGPGTVTGSILNTGSLSAIAPAGLSGVGIVIKTPIGGGVTNSGSLIGSTAAIDATGEGGATTFTQAGGMMVGSVLGSGTDVFQLTGGTLALPTSGKVNGLASFTQGAGGTLGLTFTTSTVPGTYPNVSAGRINLGGTLLVMPVGSFTAFLGKTFPNVITATTSLSGNFSNFASTNGLLAASTTPDPTTPNALDVTFGLNRAGIAASAQSLAQGLRFGLAQPQVMIDTVQNRLLGGTAYDGSAMVAANLIGPNRQARSDAGQLAQASPVPTTGTGSGASMWARAYGVIGNAPAAGTAPGFSEQREGVIIGVDWRFDQFTVGVAGNYGHTNASFADGSHTSLDPFGALIYGGWRGGPWYVTGGAGGAANSYSFIRSLTGVGMAAVATSSVSGRSYSAYGETGFAMPFDRWTVTPYGRIDFVHADTDAFTETGPEGSLRVNSSSGNSFATALGARASTRFEIGNATFTPELRVGWQHEFLDSAQHITTQLVALPGTFITATGPDFGRDSALVGLGITHDLAPNARIFIDYDGKFTGGFNQHAFTGGVKIWF